MHRTWRSKELRCQSNKHQAASEAGELEVFASPRPLSSLLHMLRTRSFHQFEFSKCKNVAITAILCIGLFLCLFLEKHRKLWLRVSVQNTSGNLSLCYTAILAIINSGRHFLGPAPPFYTRPARLKLKLSRCYQNFYSIMKFQCAWLNVGLPLRPFYSKRSEDLRLKSWGVFSDISCTTTFCTYRRELLSKQWQFVLFWVQRRISSKEKFYAHQVTHA